MDFKVMRKRTGLTQGQFGKQLGVDGQFISNIERGVAPLPVKHFRKVAKLCKIPVGKLVFMDCLRHRETLLTKIAQQK